MPGDLVNFAFVIEGKGEVEAIPLLIRRICSEILGFFDFKTTASANTEIDAHPPRRTRPGH
jgi:hypothetical protein